MKIEFEVPKWAIGRHIYIFAGTELLGNKECRIIHEDGGHVAKYLPLKVKPLHGRCNGCGSCCSDGGIPESLLKEIIFAIKNFNVKETKCVFLGDIGCILKAWIPFSCAKSLCTIYDNCSEKLEVVE